MAEAKDDKLKPWHVWAIAIAICVTVWLLGAALTRWYAAHCASSIVNNSAGVFGDSFGAVNALISALAFAGVIVTFYLQRKELDLQRQELKAQREEFTQQNKTLKLQRFENTFFHMMELQQQIVNDLFIKISDRENVWGDSLNGGRDSREVIVDNSVRGRQVFSYIYKHRVYARKYQGVFNCIIESGLNGYDEAPYLFLLDHYFRHLYTILRYVDETDAFNINDDGYEDQEYAHKQKYHYTTIVRSTLSRFELLLLYYNGLSKYGNEKLKPLIERYTLLNNLDTHGLSFSKDNLEACQIQKHSDIKWDELGLTGTDYEFYLTKEAQDKSRYLLSAFCHNSKEYNDANMALSNYKRFLAERITNQSICLESHTQDKS